MPEYPLKTQRRSKNDRRYARGEGRGRAPQLGLYELRLPRRGRATREVPGLRRRQGDVRRGARTRLLEATVRYSPFPEGHQPGERPLRRWYAPPRPSPEDAGG